MAEHLAAHALTIDELADVDELLHDAQFSMLDVKYNEGLGVVAIPFRSGSRTRDLILHKARRLASEPGNQIPADRLLQVSLVTKLTAFDPQELVEHSYSRLNWSKPGQLTLLSNFPGRLEFEVSGIDVRVTV